MAPDPRPIWAKPIPARTISAGGFAGAFCVLPTEVQEDFDTLSQALRAEYLPETVTEQILVEKMAQHLWLSRRAQYLQDAVLRKDPSLADQDSRLGLRFRYQTTNDRSFHKCLDQFVKLRAQKRKAEIGFERQKHENERAERQQSRARQQAERHKFAIALAEAKLHHQVLLNTSRKTKSEAARAA